MKKGFTLAEVLITLGIIGIVSAITIPTLINNYKKRTYVSQLKVAVSILQNGFKQMLANSNCLGQDLRCMGLFPTTITEDYYENLDKAVKSSFNVITSCKEKTGTPCNYDIKYLNGKNNFTNNNWGPGSVSMSNATKGLYQFILSNGMVVYIGNRQCGATAYPEVSGNFQYRCAEFLVDVNGVKEPNQYGRDIYMFVLGQDASIYTYAGVEFSKFMRGEAWETSDAYWKSEAVVVGNSCNIEQNGYGCAARIMENGWVMDY